MRANIQQKRIEFGLVAGDNTIMAAEPLTIFSNKVDPVGVLEVLRKRAPELTIQGPADHWTQIQITGPRRFLKAGWTLNFGHDRGYYSNADWPKQMAGMLGYFSRFPKNQNSQAIMWLIQSFRFSITLFPLPTPELFIDSDDERLGYVFEVVKHLDGVIFTPSSLRDASGRILYGVKEPDPQAIMPAIYRAVPATPRDERTRDAGGIPNVDDPAPPTAEAVARRACALAAVTGRALLKQEDRADPGVEDTRKRLLQWVRDIGIEDELEPDEIKLLQHPLGVPPQRDAINGTWRLEGLGVLAWALNRFDLPAYDTLCNPGKLLPSVAILNAQRAMALISEPPLRPQEELKQMYTHLLGLHWRLRDFSIRPRSMDFAAFAEKAWFGKLPLDNIKILEGDLALEDYPLSKAPQEMVQRCSSALQERHLAINWLLGASKIYSKTDTST